MLKNLVDSVERAAVRGTIAVKRAMFARDVLGLPHDEAVAWANQPICGETRRYQIPGDTSGLNGKLTICATAADKCDGVHHDIVRQINWT